MMNRAQQETTLALMGWQPVRVAIGNSLTLGIVKEDIFLVYHDYERVLRYVLYSDETAIAEDWHIFERCEIRSFLTVAIHDT